MKRKTKAAWIGFLVPVVPAWGIVLYVFAEPGVFFDSGWFGRGAATSMAVMFVGIPSILLGGVIAAVAFAITKNDPLKCVGCGYSLVGLENDKCPECGKKTP